MEGAEIHYASSKDWEDIIKNRSSLRMHALIQRLGLRAKWSSNKRGKTNFESPLVKALVEDTSKIVSKLPKDAPELVQHLGTPESLRQEVEDLMSKHGSEIWGRVSLREHLLIADSPDPDTRVFYPRDLYDDIEEDQMLIKMLLHWWIGLKACNVILARERLDRERKKKEGNKKAMDTDNNSPRDTAPQTFVLLAPTPNAPPTSIVEVSKGVPLLPLTHASRHAQAFRLDTPSRGSLMSPKVHTLASSKSPTMHAWSLHRGNGSQRASRDMSDVSAIPPVNGGPNHVLPVGTNGYYNINYQSPSNLRKLNLELGSFVSNFLLKDGPQGRASSNTSQTGLGDTPRNERIPRGLDFETLLAFRAYIYQEVCEVQWDEEYLLRRLECAWRDGVRTDRSFSLGSTPLFVALDRTFLTWIELRRHLADLERADRREYNMQHRRRSL
jgi:hypothetical protein